MDNLQRAQAMEANRATARNRPRLSARSQEAAPQGDTVEISQEARNAQANARQLRTTRGSEQAQSVRSERSMEARAGLRGRQFNRISVRAQESQGQPQQVGASVFLPNRGAFANPVMSPQGQNIDTGPTLQFSERTSVSFSTKG